jgi:hypothetical protein
MVACHPWPDAVKMHIPMPFRFLPAWPTEPIKFGAPGLFRLGGVDIRRTKAVRYLDVIQR